MTLVLTGGDRPHVGAVSVSLSAETSGTGDGCEDDAAGGFDFALPSHRDLELAAPIARELACRLGSPAVVVAGVHLDHVTRGEIEEVLSLRDAVVEHALLAFREGGMLHSIFGAPQENG